jgi:transcriptional regulator with XRE-family HTH domain
MIHRVLKLVRIYHHLTQAELAKKWSVSQVAISKIECGQTTITDDLLQKYSEQFKIPKSNFYFFLETIGDSNRINKWKSFCSEKVVQILEFIAEKGEFKE